MPTHYGIRKRAKPRINFKRGYTGQTAHNLQKSLHINNDAQILSGMCVSKFWNTATARHEWKIGLVTGAVPYVAYDDFDDPDVVGAGGILTAYALNDTIEFQTPYITDSDGSVIAGDIASIDDDRPLTAIAAGTTGAGSFCIATAGTPVVGYLSGGHQNALINVAAENTNVTRDADGKVLVIQMTSSYQAGNELPA